MEMPHAGLCSNVDTDCNSDNFCESVSKLCIPKLPKGLLCPEGDHSCTTGAVPAAPNPRP